MPLTLSLIAFSSALLALSVALWLPTEISTLQGLLIGVWASLVVTLWFSYRRWRSYTHKVQDILHMRTSMHLANEHILQCLNEAHVTQENLRTEAVHDPLTGLLNRRLLDDNLYREIARAMRGEHPLCAIMLDVDHFKELNDRYGHLAGDEVLKHLARIITSQARASDLAFRYGGEEFLILLPNMPESAGIQRAERWRHECEQSVVSVGNQQIRFTISAGISVFPEHADSGTAMIATADQALYKVKNAGRNHVSVFSKEA